MKSSPRYLLIVFALAGDSTMTSCLPSALAPEERDVDFFRVAFFVVFLRVTAAFGRVVFVFFAIVCVDLVWIDPI